VEPELCAGRQARAWAGELVRVVFFILGGGGPGLFRQAPQNDSYECYFRTVTDLLTNHFGYFVGS
jgi:hypothetical protein